MIYNSKLIALHAFITQDRLILLYIRYASFQIHNLYSCSRLLVKDLIVGRPYNAGKSPDLNAHSYA